MLYLKKIEIYGFKSFADKLELRFDQPITGIVGPNGCGKSNVSDAVRWVLGEQSTRVLRGKSMQDIIFSGTDIRKSMSYCEVALYLDNTTRIFPVPLDEVIISRKLYRNNESQYFLNRSVVRLKDILAMLRNVGLGKEGYSIVGQGRMDAILNAKPEDRRAIFEEALGISTFRIRKNETERKLDKTAENMKNLAILEKELSDRLGPLRRQSVQAKKYLELRDQLRYHEINAYIYAYDNASELKAQSKRKIDGATEELAQKERDYAKLDEDYDRLMHAVQDIDSTINREHELQLSMSVDLEKQSGDKRVIDEKLRNLNQEIANTKETLASFDEQILSLQNELTENNHGLANRNADRIAIENELLSSTDALQNFSRKLDNTKRELETKQQNFTDTLREIAENKQKTAAISSEMDNIKQRQQQIAASSEEFAERLMKLSTVEGNLLLRYEEEKKTKEQLQAALADTKQQIKETEFSLFEQGKQVKTKQQEVAGIAGSIEMLRDIANNFKGYQHSVQSLMQDTLRDSALASKICGVVANMLKVDVKYQLAVETALGGKLQNVVTNSEEDAKYAIGYLKEHGYGRVTFLPVTSMKPRTIERREILRENGVIGIAKDLVGFDARFAPVFQSLLGGIVIVDTFDNAIRLSKKYDYVHRMVTLTGERISSDGSIEGGSRNKSSSLLSYDSEIEQKVTAMEQKRAELATLEQAYAGSESRLAELNAKYQQCQVDLNNINVAIATDKEKIESSNTLNNSDKQAILGLEQEKDRLTARLDELDDALKAAQNEFAELCDKEKVLNYEIEAAKALILTETATKDTMQEAVTSKQLRLSTLIVNIDTVKKTVDALNLSIYRLEEDVVAKTKYLDQLNGAILILNEQLLVKDDDSAQRSELQRIQENLRSADIKKAELNKEFQIATERRMQLAGELEAVKGAIDKEEFILSKIDEDLHELQQRVYEEYGVTYSAAMQYKDEQYDIVTSRPLIGELRNTMKNMGYVNVHSIEELAEVEERYGGIGTQMEDLRKAETDLKNVLGNLTKEIEVRFEEGMTSINENFKVVFRELFKGGNAKLSLDKDPEKSPLDYGIEIEAQPPGKRLQNISLLSGGERTLTAAAILFAILRLKPMPFCVLDEIEAALDDSNAERIARYLRNFSNKTQFIVITHKKPTMENADVLYGVTMEEKGVSKVVSVKLSDAIKVAV
jgi:chromosome segregation protein